MPPFRRRYFYRNWWNNQRRRSYFRRRRPRTTFRGRKRRRKTVRRKKFYKKYHKKLKKIRIQQWQPSTIKKCRITGYLCLFQAGKGRFSYNYAQYKESFVPEHQPGGGGWSIQQLSLNNLYIQNCDLMNYWTKSNNRLNLCRYYGCRITLFREPFTDYVFTYFPECPKTVTKYFYASHHPLNLLTHNRKIIVPSYQTQPNKRKIYKKIFIPPPKTMKNQWFFQQQFSPFSLVNFAASAISLTNMWGSNNAENSNATIYTLDTVFIPHPCFQYKSPQEPQWGYRISDTKYLWGIPQPNIHTKNTYSLAAYLGNAMINDEGNIINNKQSTSYTKNDWGNPFFWGYLTQNMPVFQTTEDPSTIINKKTQEVKDTEYKQTPYVYTVRYNPFKDKGKGNQVYFIPTYAATHNSWEPTTDPDIMFENFPLWILFWGIESIIKRMGKCPHIDDDWVCVIKTKAFNTPAQHYVPLSYEFVHGLGPYNTDRSDISPDDNRKWYPKWKFQKQAIENIINTGPAVCRADNTKNIQATIKYDFFFKWGGNPAPMESVYDPTTQPVTPTPSGLQLQNEITNPETDISSFLYQWDTRRDFITQSAIERIKKSSSDDKFMFTDGRQTSTDLPLFETLQTTPQEETTPKEQAETLLQQLEQLQQYNNQLQQRFLRLKQSLEDQ